MKILSIIEQKPNSTGSGTYLREICKCLNLKNIAQELICGIYEDDIKIIEKELSNDINIRPVIFDSEKLPLKIVGMSDTMPYKSMTYFELFNDNEKFEKWRKCFEKEIIDSIENFKPDIIICHHLYYVSALVSDIVSNNKKIKLIGICHGSEIRQYNKIDFYREYIKKNIANFDKIFSLTEYQKEQIKNIFDINENKIQVVGTGYNKELFYIKNNNVSSRKNKLLYVGKIAKSKGVLSLIKSINLLNDENLTLDLIGGSGNMNEYDEIFTEAKKSKSKINFLGAMGHSELAIEYNNHELLVFPSFYEGLCIVPIEALACGCKVVMSNISHIKKYYDNHIKNGDIIYIDLPKLINVDEPDEKELPHFEKHFANGIKEALSKKSCNEYIDLSDFSWEKISNYIISE